MARLEREARVLASLNHPTIATICGLEDSAIVMELVEGPTLAERIARGPIGFGRRPTDRYGQAYDACRAIISSWGQTKLQTPSE